MDISTFIQFVPDASMNVFFTITPYVSVSTPSQYSQNYIIILTCNDQCDLCQMGCMSTSLFMRLILCFSSLGSLFGIL